MTFWRKGHKSNAAVLRLVGRYVLDRRGNISAMVALLIFPLVGILGLATETGSWFLIQRSMQNAADSAVLAAGANGSINPIGVTYITEGRSVATDFGYTDGLNSTTVTPVNNQACPPPRVKSDCYKVTISRTVPLNLTRIVGYTGVGGAQLITASAIAGPKDVILTYCILTLGNAGQGITINGGPNVNLNGCNIASNSNANNATKCNGQNPGAANVTAVGTADPGCGLHADSGHAAISDGYASLAATNAADLTNNCGGNYNGSIWNSNHILPAAATSICGTLTLNKNVVVTTASPGSVLVIQNGQLNLNGFSLTTPSGSGLTIVFNTPAGQANIVPFPNNSGTLNMAAPTSGPWSGVALYQNRQNGSAAIVNETYAGNTPTWDITGLVYLPKVSLTFKGIVNKSSNGYSCFAIVVNDLTISGNGAIYSNAGGECRQAGLQPPSTQTAARITLLQ